jgi:hypothetical protein
MTSPLAEPGEFPQLASLLTGILMQLHQVCNVPYKRTQYFSHLSRHFLDHLPNKSHSSSYPLPNAMLTTFFLNNHRSITHSSSICFWLRTASLSPTANLKSRITLALALQVEHRKPTVAARNGTLLSSTTIDLLPRLWPSPIDHWVRRPLPLISTSDC